MIFLRILVIASLTLISVSNRIQTDEDEEEIEDGDLFEGDIAGISMVRGAAQNILPNTTRWTNKTIPYVISDEFNATYKDIIMDGIKLIEDATRTVDGKDCIRIVPRTNEKSYIKIINGSGCSSHVGKIQTGFQQLSLKIPSCVKSGIVAHEFIHALGFWHEHSRPDRDNYIKIQTEQIKKGKNSNFKKYNQSLVGLLDFPYDYGSIMHYRNNTFSKNKKYPTIIPLQEGVVIGQRTKLSPIDVDELRRYYDC